MSPKDSSKDPTVEELTAKVVAFRDARDWKQFHTVKDMLLSLSLEVAELSEHFQWKSEEDSLKYLKEAESKHAVGEELSDILYWVLLLANDFNIDLPEAFEQKMAKNATKYNIEKFAGKNKKYNHR